MKNERLIVALLVMCGAMLQTLAGVLPKINSRQSPQSTVGFKTNNESLGGMFLGKRGQTRETMAKLEVEVPLVEVDLFGGKYSVGGSQVCIPVRLVPSLGNGVAAQWNSNERVIEITKEKYDWEQMKPGFAKWWQGEWWQIGSLIGTGIEDEEDAFWRILRHEAIHALVATKYEKGFEDENGQISGEVNDWYHFMSEMLAYVGGDGMSLKEAAKHIRNEDKHYKGASDIAKKFLNGEPYTPPKGESKKDERDSPELVVQSETNEVDGVRGWCSCGDQWRPIKPGVSSSEKGLAYTLCVKCGKCVKSSRENNLLYGVKCNDVVMWDRDYARNLCGKYGVNPPKHWMVLSLHCLQGSNGILPTKGDCEFYAEVSRAQEKYFKIPDGEIVVPGRCSCAAPDVSLVGKETSKPFMVCTRCGLVNEPKNGNGINSKVRDNRSGE